MQASVRGVGLGFGCFIGGLAAAAFFGVGPLDGTPPRLSPFPVATTIPPGGTAFVIADDGYGYVVDEYGNAYEVWSQYGKHVMQMNFVDHSESRYIAAGTTMNGIIASVNDQARSAAIKQALEMEEVAWDKRHP